MQAIIFANRSATELAPLNRQYCAALLPVANKALIEYTLEDLSCAGITHAKIVIANKASEIEAHIRSGAKWNLTVDYFLSKPEEDVDTVLQRMQLDINQPQLIVRGDIIRSPCIAEFIEFASQFPQTFVSASMEDKNPGLIMLPAGKSYCQNLNWPLASSKIERKIPIYQVLHGKTFYLDTLESYVFANRYISNRAEEFSLKGRLISNDINTLDVLIEPNSKIPTFFKQNIRGMIGSNCFVDKQVTCSGSIIIGQHCYIENSELSNSIILPNTFIGKNLSLVNKIVSQDYIIDITKNTWVQVQDQNLVSATVAKTMTKTSLSTQITAMLLLLVCLPLVLLSLIAAFILQPKHPIKRFNAYSNQQSSIELYEIAINAPLLAKLPQLWNVIKGELLLFGASSTHNQHAQYGVFGPVQLLLDKDAPEEEVELVEMEFQLLSQLGYVKRLWQLI